MRVNRDERGSSGAGLVGTHALAGVLKKTLGASASGTWRVKETAALHSW